MATINIGNNTGNSGGLQDTRLDSAGSGGNDNYGTHSRGYTGWQSASRIMRCIQRWNLSSIPAGSICNSATLYLYDTDWANRAADCTTTLYKISDANADWVEGTTSDTPQEGSASWNYKAYHAVSPVSWAGSGGLSTAGTDYVNTSLGSTVFTDGVSGYRTITLTAAGLTALEGWFGTTGGGGWLLIGTQSGGAAWTEWHSAVGTDGDRPYLAIDYTLATKVGSLLTMFK